VDKWVREGCGGCDRRDGGVAVGSCSVLQGDRATRQQKWRNIVSFLGVMGNVFSMAACGGVWNGGNVVLMCGKGNTLFRYLRWELCEVAL